MAVPGCKDCSPGLDATLSRIAACGYDQLHGSAGVPHTAKAAPVSRDGSSAANCVMSTVYRRGLDRQTKVAVDAGRAGRSTAGAQSYNLSSSLNSTLAQEPVKANEVSWVLARWSVQGMQIRAVGGVCVVGPCTRERREKTQNSADGRGGGVTIQKSKSPYPLSLSRPLSPSKNARAHGSGMGNSASPALLKAWLSWLKSGFLLRLVGLPAAIIALHLEIYGSSYRYSVILHRLSSRLRLARLTCRLDKGHDSGMNSIFYVGGADVMDRAHSHKPSSRKQSLTPDLKERAQPSGAAPVSAAAPQNKNTPAASPTASTLAQPSPTVDMHAHARSMSHADVVRQGKRLSLQFPIQPAAAGSSSPAASSPRSRPQSWIAAPSPVPSPDAASAEPNILTVIAAQERYVLELKEELSKAEQDLKTLKRHYATQEATKVRNDLRKVTKLQPLNTTLANYGSDQDDQDGSSLWMQKEMERRKALLSAKSAQRGKVFSGSRHLRTLSLLSPDKSYSPSFPQPLDLLNDEPPTPATTSTTTVTTNQRLPPLSRTSTSPDIANHIASTVNADRYDLGGLSNIQREALLRTGKQMATDFKDGFLTFIEDIRQATVGDDAANGAENAGPGHAKDASTKGLRKTSENRPALNRAASSKKSGTSKTGDIGDDFWKEHGLSEPKASPTHKKTHAFKQTRTPQKQTQDKDDDFESWDNWETPVDKHVHSTKVSGGNNSSDESEGPSSPVSGQASSRTSTRYHSQRHDSKASTLTADSSAGLPDESSRRDSKRNSIPWPELSKLSPSQLKRTASHLMKEWEKNLTPPPESRDFNHGSGDYIGRSVSPSDFA
ncbi:hypothetical protein N0V90_008922 [Kalmusia sp. IMI 367209]|nr:hypothetical protein N0V90_008922 [Kalmusia sp. IMI 367209]